MSDETKLDPVVNTASVAIESSDTDPGTSHSSPAGPTPMCASSSAVTDSATAQMGPSVIVKAASQSVPDMTIDCQLDWNVVDLKKYISGNHSLRPCVKEQRLIYSGRLLTDELSLSSVLSGTGLDDMRYVLHLVCAPSRQDSSSASDSSIINSAPTTSSSSATTTAAAMNVPGTISYSSSATTTASSSATVSTAGSSDGVRRRTNVNNVTPEPTVVQPSERTAININVQAPPTAINNAQLQNLSANELNQLYAHYMYLSYMVAWDRPYWLGESQAQEGDPYAYWLAMQQAGLHQSFGVAPTPLSPPTVEGAPPAAADPPPPDAQAGVVPNDQVVAPPPLNVPGEGGGAFGGAEVVDEDGQPRDWFDAAYAVVRFSMFMFLIYSYSTVYRFATVMAVASLFFLYNVGWFRRRGDPRNNNGGRNNARADANPAAEPDQANQPQAEPAVQQAERDGVGEENGAQTVGDTQQPERQRTVDVDSQVEEEQREINEAAEAQEIINLMDAGREPIANNADVADAAANTGNGDNGGDHGPENQTENVPIPEPVPQQSLLTVTWNFVTDFVTSLIPEIPEPIM